MVGKGAEGLEKTIAADEKYMRMAEDLFYQELGSALIIPKNQILDYLLNRITKDN